jgi:hypothetical protein
MPAEQRSARRKTGVVALFQRVLRQSLAEHSLPKPPPSTKEALIRELNVLSPVQWQYNPKSSSISVLVALEQPDIRLAQEWNPRSIIGTGAFYKLNQQLPTTRGLTLHATQFEPDMITCQEDCKLTQFKRLAIAINTEKAGYSSRVARIVLEHISMRVAPYVARFEELHRSGAIPSQAYDMLMRDPVLEQHW